MLHKKREHADSVSDCWNFNAGVCEWDKNCWFLHSEEKIKTDFKCIVCDENFQTKMNDMDHTKRNHENVTPKFKILGMDLVTMELIVGLDTMKK